MRRLVHGCRFPRLAVKLGHPRAHQTRCITMASRTYNDAIEALNTLQTPHAKLQARLKAGIKPDATFVHEMKVCLQRIGYTQSDLDRLNVIHVAGTKGKGTTCAFVDSILAQYGQKPGDKPLKRALFSSPHLIAVRERMRIDSAPVSKDLFARYFFDVWDRLAVENHKPDNDDSAVPAGTRPTYARFLTLVSWHMFLQESVDVAVYETGIGGEFDATNLIEQPIVTGITHLEIDHVFALGDTIEKIAWHKAGIMKTGSPAFTVPQTEAAAGVLQRRAEEKGVHLRRLDIDRRLLDLKIRPQADFMLSNATLAMALAETALRRSGLLEGDISSSLPTEFVDGLEKKIWRGRNEVKQDGNVKWCLDGAHTLGSISTAAKWFAEESSTSTGPRVLIFNQQGRTEALDFLRSLYEASEPTPFTHVIFTTNRSAGSDASGATSTGDFINNQFDPATLDAMTVQQGFADHWQTLDEHGAEVKLAPTVNDALAIVKKEAQTIEHSEEVSVLVTGSLHLVGAVLSCLEDVDAL